ncbi:MAG: hypothetical protein H6523_18550 [Mycolicibacterium sp.]|jgi:hypothetical protein|nr:hypothetical protein [Mycobacterium sp.]MCB9442230.1 hypothetical protein [Mycolicibacterium sp.]
MSRTIRALAITGAAATLSLGLAIPASADDFAGQYTLTLDQESATWTVRPCEDADPAAGFVQCVHVAQSGGKEVPWESVATWAVGYWTLRVQRPDVMACDDGKEIAALTTYSWDAVTLAGHMSFLYPGGCGDAPEQSVAVPFTLAKGAAPVEPKAAEVPA